MKKASWKRLRRSGRPGLCPGPFCGAHRKPGRVTGFANELEATDSNPECSASARPLGPPA